LGLGRTAWITLFGVLAFLFPACVVYEPVPAVVLSAPSYDRVWDSALGAAQDAGVAIFSANKTTGIIRGARSETQVTITVMTQADGRNRVEFTTRGPDGQDAELNATLTSFYNRRMGR